MADSLHDCDEHTLYPRDQPGQRRTTRRIVSTAGAAAWLPHSRLCATVNPTWKAVSPLVCGMEALVRWVKCGALSTADDETTVLIQWHSPPLCSLWLCGDILMCCWTTVSSGHRIYHTPDREYGWRGSGAVARQMIRYGHDERARQPIQRLIAS